MRKIAYIIGIAVASFGFAACDNSLDKVFDEQTLIEFDQTVTTNPAVGRNYPLIAVPNNLTAATTLTTRLNLVGRQRGSELSVRVLPDPAATTAPATSYSISNGGTAVFAPQSSTALVTVTVSRTTSTTAPTANLVLVIDSTGTDWRPSQNFKRIGWTFRQ
ncbi:hypothetical protein [Spirosoma montaniterrae]|uniref:DUF4843 domain-containing protein n=1 Tax=Spirosoma montaniterrae TaxID=1178516 RepID=A0A1P9WSZ9_9BACT|nr:hypothetical protein [Spirosoma montaniterrae]AQG78511.1 hypothetical protein AWR27_03630 [Spirosoma montaniterrae]